MNHLFTSSRLLVFLTAFAVLLAACQPQTPAATPQPTDAPPQPAATATSVTPDDPNAIDRDILLDPALARDADSARVNQYLYEGLVSLDADGNAQPAIAESWVISDDTLAYTFTLRPDAVFSDGSPITPDDIVANVTRWLDPQSPLRGDGDYATWKEIFGGFLGEKDADGRPLSPVDGVQKVELNTVIIHLNRPVPELLTYLANPAFAILNPEALEQGSYGTMTSQIISTGPYQVSSWTDDSLTLSPNPAYWGMVAQVEMEFTFR